MERYWGLVRSVMGGAVVLERPHACSAKQYRCNGATNYRSEAVWIRLGGTDTRTVDSPMNVGSGGTCI